MGIFKKNRYQEPEEIGNPYERTSKASQWLEESAEYTKQLGKQTEEEKWEQRRWELVRYLVAQDRRSVILGKLRASSKAIAAKARELADATIEELRNNQMKSYGK